MQSIQTLPLSPTTHSGQRGCIRLLRDHLPMVERTVMIVLPIVAGYTAFGVYGMLVAMPCAFRLLPSSRLKDSAMELTCLCSAILVKTWVHEIGHYYAFKGLFDDVDPSIQVNWYGGGYCDSGGPAENLSPLGQHFTHDTALAIVAAAGPMATVAQAFGAAALAHKMSTIRKLENIAEFLVINAVVCSMGTLHYSVTDFELIVPGLHVNHDFQSISNLLEISRISLVAITMLSIIMPCYLSSKTRTKLRLLDEAREDSGIGATVT